MSIFASVTVILSEVRDEKKGAIETEKGREGKKTEEKIEEKKNDTHIFQKINFHYFHINWVHVNENNNKKRRLMMMMTTMIMVSVLRSIDFFFIVFYIFRKWIWIKAFQFICHWKKYCCNIFVDLFLCRVRGLLQLHPILVLNEKKNSLFSLLFQILSQFFFYQQQL